MFCTAFSALFFHIASIKIMASKERKGGLLKNQDIERELERTGANNNEGQAYRGSQDNGDQKVRELGTEVQQRDGADEEADTENT